VLGKKESKIINDISQISEDAFTKGALIERVEFEKLSFESWSFNSCRLQSCTFSNCNFEDCILDSVDFQRVEFQNCVFKNCILSKGFRYITGVSLNTSFIDCDLRTAFIQNVKFLDSSFDGTDLQYIKVKSIDFTGSKFKKIKFDGAAITRGKFLNVEGIKRSQFRLVKLDDCEFDWQEAFIIMEFGNNKHDSYYKRAIVPVLEKLEITPRRVDQYEFHGRITDEILDRIITSKIVIAECSETNKNVYFEVGYAMGNNKDVILCIDSADKIPFDLQDFPFLVYDNCIDTLESRLETRIRFLLGMSDGS